MGAPHSERPTNRDGISLHAAWRAEAFWLSCSFAGRSSSFLADRGGRDPGTFRRAAPAHRLSLSASGFPAFRRNGGSLFHGSCPAGILALVEQRGTGRYVLFRILLPICGRRRLLGRRLPVAARGYFSQLGELLSG